MDQLAEAVSLKSPVAARVSGSAFALTLFASAALIFILEPMFGRLILPRFGGTPAVWTTVMLFFQTALLVGYGYAHLLSGRLALRWQIAIHLTLSLLALGFLPIALPMNWQPQEGVSPAASIALIMATTVGAPFVVLSATAPLLQRWFSKTDLPGAGNPYFLYAASNLGSLLGLIGYPALIEPLLGLSGQSRGWAAAYIGLLILVVLCSYLAVRRSVPATANAVAGIGRSATTPRPAWSLRLRWVGLAAAPSSLFLAVTMHLSTDVAAMPLLWVLPLSLYLLTFVIVFARRPAVSHFVIMMAVPYVVLVFLLVNGLYLSSIALQITVHLLILSVLALACHGELSRLRPAPDHLTEYYLWMSAGGALGGVFNGIVAPAIFDSVQEYGIAVGLATVLWASAKAASEGKSTPLGWRDGILALALGVVLCLSFEPLAQIELKLAYAFKVAVLAVCFVYRKRPRQFALIVVAILLSGALINGNQLELGRARSFFGVHRIEIDPKSGAHKLVHGSTVHGAQYTDAARRREPQTYFSRPGPVGQVFTVLQAGHRLNQVGIIGLGAGSMACYAQPAEHWTYFEIDPAIVATAKDPRYFTFLADCKPDARIVLGDGRLTLAAEPAGSFDLFAVDAFGSDSIPVHLLTREAFQLYVSRLSPNGVLLLHLSNRNLYLLPVAARLADDLGLAGRWQIHIPESGEANALAAPSLWAVLARRDADLSALASDPRWKPLEANRQDRVWTDDYANVIGIINWH